MIKRSKMVWSGDWLTKEITFKQLLPAWSGREWLGALVLVAALFLTYLPVWTAGFVWDDHSLVTANPYLHGLAGLKLIWMSRGADICPLTVSTFWVEHALWGLAPVPYHLVTLILHAAAAVVLWRVLLVLRVPGAWFGAALWALHPVNVESVAWISEMKNTESGLFFLFAILFFGKWVRDRGAEGPAGNAWNYRWALLFAALAMASKSSTVILPVVFCLVAWWIEGRWQWRNLARVAPVFLLAVAASAVSIWTQGFSLAAVTDPMFTRTGPERVVTAGVAVWFYLGKLFWPHPLMALYPRWHFDATKGSSWLPVLAVFIALFILGRKRESWARAPFFVFAYFLAALLPALGLLDNYIFHYSLVFDHFQYLAGMGPMALAAVGLVRLACLVNLGRTWLRSSLGAVVLLILGLLSFQRAAVFRSELTLWGDTLAKYPDSWPADYDYGLALAEAGRHDEAKRHFERMLELYPNCPEGHISLGLSLLDEGHADAAIAEFETALKINPNSGEAYNNIGDALLKKGKEDEAMAEFAKAAEVSPYLAEASYNYGQILLKKGMRDAAIAEFQEALHADPDMATAHYDLGRAYARKGQNDAAIEEFQACLDIEPNDEDACNNLGLVLVQMGRMAEGVARYQQALAINPNSASAHSNLGAALFQMGQKEEATVHLRRALEIDPNSEEANNNLGNAFLAGGQLDAAIAQYQKALAIHPTFIDAHRNLGVALLCKGQARDSIVQLAEVARQIPNDRVTQDLLAKAQALARPKPAGK